MLHLAALRIPNTEHSTNEMEWKKSLKIHSESLTPPSLQTEKHSVLKVFFKINFLVASILCKKAWRQKMVNRMGNYAPFVYGAPHVKQCQWTWMKGMNSGLFSSKSRNIFRYSCICAGACTFTHKHKGTQVHKHTYAQSSCLHILTILYNFLLDN